MNEPTWVQILEVMYNEEPPKESVENGGERELYTAEWLAENTSLPKGWVDNTSARMKQWGLVTKEGVSIEGAEDTNSQIQFTKDGFDVAHDREMSKRNYSINRALVLFTVFLVMVGLVGPIPNEVWSPRGIMGIVVLLGLVVVLYHPNLLPETPY